MVQICGNSQTLKKNKNCTVFDMLFENKILRYESYT